MDLMQIKGFHRVNGAEGTSRMPGASEHGLFIRWDNDLGYFVYTCIKGSDDELFVDAVTYVDGILTVHRNDNTQWVLDIAALTDFDLDLPGDTMILFDENDTIGGRINMTYDYTNQRIILTDSQGIFGKNTTYDTNIQNIIQYLGQNSLYINYGAVKSPSDMSNNNAIGYSALGAVITGDNNVALGSYAGANVSSTSSNNVFIGNYAGRLEPGDDKLYIHNSDFTTLGEFQDGSLLYGDFSIGRLWINDRLVVGEEIKIGTFDTNNTPEGGMIQFVIEPLAPTLVKPQYYDNVEWKDFVSINAITNVTQEGNEITFVTEEGDNIVITIDDTSYPSSGDQYRVQLSDGDGTFTHSEFLNWLAPNILEVNGAIRVYPNEFSDFTPTEGLMVNIGEHVYMYLDGEYRQLDNEPTSGEANKGENIGSGDVEWYAGFNIVNKNLQFYTFSSTDPRITLYQNTENETVDIGMDYTIIGTSPGTIGEEVLKGVTGGTDSIVTEIEIKRLYSSDASVIITPYDDYLDLVVDVEGLSVGEINTASNVGLGVGIFYRKNVYDFEFKSIIAGSNVTFDVTDGDITINATDNNDQYTASNLGTGEIIYKQTVANDFQFKTLVAGSDIILTPYDDYIQIDATGAGGGESNTASNIGTGSIEWYKEKVGVDLRFRTFDEITSGDPLNPYGRITFTLGDTILIGTTAELNTMANVGGYVELYKEKVDEEFKIKTLQAGSGVVLTDYDDYIRVDATGIGGGEVNTMTNVGGGYEWYRDKNGVNFNIRTLLAGSNITVTQLADTIEIAGTANSTYAMANIGTGAGLVYRDATGSNPTTFNLRKIKAGNYTTVTLVGDDIVIDALAGTAGEKNTASNIGGYNEVYASKVGVDFRFRTLYDEQNITITQNTSHLSFVVPELVQSASNLGAGSGIYKDYTETDYKRVLNFRSLVGVGDVEVNISGDTIEIGLDSDLAIPAIDGDIIPISTNLDKTLTWYLGYDADIRNSSPTSEGIVQLNLGSNLYYNVATNTLDSVSGSGNPVTNIYNSNIVRNVDGTVDRDSSNRNVKVILQNATEILWDGTTGDTEGLGWLAFENDFPVASDIQKGIVQIDTSNGWLTIVDGVLTLVPGTIPDILDAVLYYNTAEQKEQYSLHDEDNTGTDGLFEEEEINVRRARARGNIGSAYVNGSFDEIFKADSLEINKPDSTIGVKIDNNYITSESDSINLVKPKATAPTDFINASQINVSNGNIDIVLDSRDLTGDVGNINFYMYHKDTGAKVKVAVIKGRYEGDELVADFKIKGNIMFHCTDAEMNS